MYKEIPNVPSVQLFDHLKLRASVAVVGHENYTEFFLTDIKDYDNNKLTGSGCRHAVFFRWEENR